VNPTQTFWKMIGVAFVIPGILILVALDLRDGRPLPSSVRNALRDWRYAFFE
jgi:hypothetical protein